MAKCNAKTKSGKRCEGNATANGKCPMHQGPGTARELARRGVEARRRAAGEADSAAKIAAPKSPEELLWALTEVFADLKNGTLSVAVGRTMANVGQVILKGLNWLTKKQLNELEERLRERSAESGTNKEASTANTLA
jgi:hypothetical protein